MSDNGSTAISIIPIASVLLMLGGLGTALYDFYLGASAGDPTAAVFTAGMVTLGIGLVGFGLYFAATDAPSLRAVGFFVCGTGTALYAAHTVIGGDLGSKAAGAFTIGSWLIATLLLKAANQQSAQTVPTS